MEDKLLEQLKKLDNEILEWIIFELMLCRKLSFSRLASLHTEYLEKLIKHDTEEFSRVRGEIIDIWCDNKKNVGKNLVALMREFKNKGWVNIRQEQIEKSKWNK